MHPAGNLVADTCFAAPEVIGLRITDAAEVGTFTVINATPVDVSDACPDCRSRGTKRDHVQRRLVDLPVVGVPTRLHVRDSRFTCTNPTCCGTILQDLLPTADDGAKLTHRVTRWILQRLAVDRISVTETAKALGVSWQLVNNVAAAADRRLSEMRNAFPFADVEGYEALIPAMGNNPKDQHVLAAAVRSDAHTIVTALPTRKPDSLGHSGRAPGSVPAEPTGLRTTESGRGSPNAGQ